MSIETAPVAPQSRERPSRWPNVPPRLWFPLVLIASYWAAVIIVDRLEKPYFVAFLFGLITPVVLGLVIAGWWWLNRKIRLGDRLFGFLAVLLGGLVAVPLVHPSVGPFGLLMTGLPVVLTAWTLWMIAVKWAVPGWYRWGTIVVAVVTWGSLMLVRNDGLDGNLRSDLVWRWRPTAEELFVAEREAERKNNAQTPATVPPSVTTQPGDWTEFRGAERDGVFHGTTIAADWDRNPPKLVWKKRVGPSWSSVIIVDGRLFTQEQHLEKEAVVCYDAATGNEIWCHEDSVRFWESVSGAGPRATPTFVNGRLYTLGATGVLNCLDAATGNLYWTQNIADEAGAKPPQWGYSCSPLVVDGLVIVHAGGDGEKKLLAYRPDAGNLAWTANAGGGSSYSSPQLATLDGQRQVLMLGDSGLTSVDPASGTILWKAGKSMAGGPRCVQPRVVGPNQLLVGNLDVTGTSLIDVKCDGDSWTVMPKWKSDDLKPEFPDFVLHNGYAFGFDLSVFCCIDAKTGKRQWKEGRYGHGQVILLADQSLLVVVSETGEIVLLKADSTMHEELGRFQAIKGKTWSHPVIAHGRLYVRNAEEMACYEVGGGK
jgi:outer membrane protein assembly factor BamB